jgi:hypothetical protein
MKSLVLGEVRGSNPTASIIFTKQNMSQSNEGHVAPKHWATCPLLICFQYDTCHHMIGQPPANNNAPHHQTANSAAKSSYGRLRQLYGLCHVSSTTCPVSAPFFFTCLARRTDRDIFSIQTLFAKVNIPPESGRRDRRNGTIFIAFQAL